MKLNVAWASPSRMGQADWSRSSVCRVAKKFSATLLSGFSQMRV